MPQLPQENFAPLVLQRLRHEFGLKKAVAVEDDLWKDLRADEDGLSEFVERLLLDCGVNPDSVDPRPYDAVRTVRELVGFIESCCRTQSRPGAG